MSNDGDDQNGEGRGEKQGGSFQAWFWWLLVIGVIVLLVVVSNKQETAAASKVLSQPEFMTKINAGEVDEVRFYAEGGTYVQVEYRLTKDKDQKDKWEKIAIVGPERLAQLLEEKGIRFSVTRQDGFTAILLNFVLPLLLIGVLFYFLFARQIRNAGKGAMQFGKSRARLITPNADKVTFKDVAGIDEARSEVEEIVDFLREPAKYRNLGGRLPKGCLMVGPPGTGKTLLARAIAGEAGVPFYSISGSDFVEMFVGVGASRVRDLFEQAKKSQPCILFIDEIDAVGRARNNGGVGGGHDEREQTLNALLVEMDGFEANSSVIVLAATNRADVLDAALLRPGRFDRRISVDLPDANGRLQILKVHARKVKMDASCDLETTAKGTPGFSGADLSSLINEAALISARRSLKAVSAAELEEARDKVRWGRERRSMRMSQKELRNTAYHEAGHTIISLCCDHATPLHKVTIVPRGQALGATFFLPDEDKYSRTRNELLDSICVATGGRLAEEMVFGDFTNGAAGDIRQATAIARKMICDWGMSARLGFRYFDDQGESRLSKDFSDVTARIIDEEVQLILDQQMQRGRDILTTYREGMDKLATLLLEKETLNADEVREILGFAAKVKEEKAPLVIFTPDSPVVKTDAPDTPGNLEPANAST